MGVVPSDSQFDCQWSGDQAPPNRPTRPRQILGDGVVQTSRFPCLSLRNSQCWCVLRIPTTTLLRHIMFKIYLIVSDMSRGEFHRNRRRKPRPFMAGRNAPPPAGGTIQWTCVGHLCYPVCVLRHSGLVCCQGQRLEVAAGANGSIQHIVARQVMAAQRPHSPLFLGTAGPPSIGLTRTPLCQCVERASCKLPHSCGGS